MMHQSVKIHVACVFYDDKKLEMELNDEEGYDSALKMLKVSKKDMDYLGKENGTRA